MGTQTITTKHQTSKHPINTMNMYTTYPADATPTKKSLQMLIACANLPGDEHNADFSPTNSSDKIGDNKIGDKVINFLTKALDPAKAVNLMTSFMRKDSENRGSMFSEVKEAFAHGQAKHQDTAVKGWNLLFSKLCLGGYAIPGWLIALVSVLIARYFASPIVVVGLLIAIGGAYFSSEDSDLRKVMMHFYSSLNEDLSIPAPVIGLLATLAAVYFSKTILDSVLFGVAAYILYSVFKNKKFGDIMEDVKKSFTNEGDSKNVIPAVYEAGKRRAS